MSRAEQAAAMSRLLLMVQDKEQKRGSVGKRVLFEMWLQMKTSPRGPLEIFIGYPRKKLE